MKVDPRFLLANERTLLAWTRTALAMVVAGVGLTSFLPPSSGATRVVIGLGLVVFGAVLGLVSFVAWRQRLQALLRDEDLPNTRLPLVSLVVLLLVAGGGFVAVLLLT